MTFGRDWDSVFAEDFSWVSFRRVFAIGRLRIPLGPWYTSELIEAE